MSQPSIIHYFNSKKRSAVDEYKLENKNKLLKLDQCSCENPPSIFPINIQTEYERRSVSSNSHKLIQQFVNTSKKKESQENSNSAVNKETTNDHRCVTPPQSQGIKKKAKDLNAIKNLLQQSTKCSKLKNTIDRFNKCAEKLEGVEVQIQNLSKSPNLKTFKSLEFEVTVSPQKQQSPEKLYLSPKKGGSTRKNLSNVLSPKKHCSTVVYDTRLPTDDVSKERVNLQLPFKYKTLLEMFRALETVVQLLYNRKEVITFKKLKPAIEELVKRSFLLRHVAQIKSIYPNAYDYSQKKVKMYGTGLGQTQWELVLTPAINTEFMTTQDLLNRRRIIHQILIDKIKDYHHEFLLSLTPPIVISKEDITHWHPEFDLEKVPEVTLAVLPESPLQPTYTSGKEVLENAHRLFNCNKRMNQALLNLKATSDKKSLLQKEKGCETSSVIKGIPQALLEKVRQKQVANALISMTRTADKEKEVNMFNRLPEIARFVRNLFVTEKKVVLELSIVVDKLTNSYSTFLSKLEIENHLKTISSEVPGWLVFHNIRNSIYLKLAKNADLSVVISKLETRAKQKSES